MANSYLDYRGRSVRLNDQLLTIIAIFAGEFSRRNSPANAEMKEAIESWEFECIHAGPGLIVIDLDGVWDSVEGRTELLCVLEGVERMIRECGDTVPKDWLNGRVPTDDIVFVDTPCDIVLASLKKFTSLIRGT